MLDVVAGVLVVEWWTTVAVCAGAVTVSVRAGVVTVWVRAGSVTVSVCAGSVTVLVGVVFCATVPVSRLDPLAESVAVVVALDDVSVRAVVGVALLFVVADGLVDAVRVCATLLATLWTFPEPHPATATRTATSAAFVGHPLRSVIEFRMPPQAVGSSSI